MSDELISLYGELSNSLSINFKFLLAKYITLKEVQLKSSTKKKNVSKFVNKQLKKVKDEFSANPMYEPILKKIDDFFDAV